MKDIGIGTALWGIGIIIPLLFAWNLPDFLLNGIIVGGLLGGLGIYLVSCGLDDEFVDDFQSDLKQGE